MNERLSLDAEAGSNAVVSSRVRRASEPLTCCSRSDTTITAPSDNHAINPDTTNSSTTTAETTLSLCRRLRMVHVNSPGTRTLTRPRTSRPLRPPPARSSAPDTAASTTRRGVVLRPSRLSQRRSRRRDVLLRPARVLAVSRATTPSHTSQPAPQQSPSSSQPATPDTTPVTASSVGCSVQHRRVRKPVSVDVLCSMFDQTSIMSPMAEMMYT